MDMMLYGGKNGYGVASKYAKHDFTYDLAQEGLFKMLERWFKESTSEKIRNWAEDFMTIDTCSECNGLRLKKESLHFKLNEKNIGELAEMDVAELAAWTDNVGKTFSKRQKEIAKDVVKEIRLRLGFLLHVGLDYLSLNRPARSMKMNTLTADYLRDKKRIEVPTVLSDQCLTSRSREWMNWTR